MVALACSPTVNELDTFLHQSTFYEVAGSVVPFSRVVAQYLKWLDTDERQLAWLQHQRIERAFIAAGFPVGRCAILGAPPHKVDCLYVGNLGHEHWGRSISERPLVLEPELEILLPRDLTPTEMRALRL